MTNISLEQFDALLLRSFLTRSEARGIALLQYIDPISGKQDRPTIRFPIATVTIAFLQCNRHSQVPLVDDDDCIEMVLLSFDRAVMLHLARNLIEEC